MSDQVFPVTPPVGEPPKPEIQIPDQAKEFIGEGKKYATVEEALKSIPHAQRHIETLSQQQQALKAEADKIRAERETYELLLKQQSEHIQPPVVSGLDATQVERLLEQRLQREKVESAQKANIGSVQAELNKRFGEKAQEVFENRAKELGLDLNALASTSPKAVLELFPKAKETSASPSGSVNTSALSHVAKAVDHKPVMFGSTTADLIAAWRRAAPKS